MTLLARTVRLVLPLGAAELIIVLPPRALRARAELRHCPVTVVENSQRAGGLSTSISRGLAAARAGSAVLILPVDLVHLKRRDLVRLITRWQGARRHVVARRLQDHGGVPLILPRWLYARALGFLGTRGAADPGAADRGLKALIEQLPPMHVKLVNLPRAARDIDTPEDLEWARRRIQGCG